jgi:hypothetical protein
VLNASGDPQVETKSFLNSASTTNQRAGSDLEPPVELGHRAAQGFVGDCRWSPEPALTDTVIPGSEKAGVLLDRCDIPWRSLMVRFRSVGLNALTLATVLFFSPVLANVKPHHYYGYHRHYRYGYSARWCWLDTSPRDPVYFKKADNRCGGVIW